MKIIRNLSGFALVFLVGASVTGLTAQENNRFFSGNRPDQNIGTPIGLSGPAVFPGAASAQNSTRHLHRKSDWLVNELRNAHAASTAEQKEAAAEVIESTEERLRYVVGTQFDLLIQKREEQVKQLRDRVSRLEFEITKSRDAKKQIVELRLQTLMNETNGLGFPSTQLPGGINIEHETHSYFDSALRLPGL